MYAIVDIVGQQFKVQKKNKVFVHRLENEEGSQVSFEKVLLIDNDGKVSVGQPTVDGASVVATVVSHLKGDKVLVFKKKRRKGYQKMNGHRQYLTEIVIEDILEKGQKAKAVAAKPATNEKKEDNEVTEVKEAPAKKEAAPKADVKNETAAKPAAKKATDEAKNAVTKKPATKKPEAKKAAPKKSEDKAK